MRQRFGLAGLVIEQTQKAGSRALEWQDRAAQAVIAGMEMEWRQVGSSVVQHPASIHDANAILHELKPQMEVTRAAVPFYTHRPHTNPRRSISSTRDCHRFFDNRGPAACPHALRSSVSVSIFRQFVSALEGGAVAITNANILGPSQLCEEFGFEDLAVKLSRFRRIGSSAEAPTVVSALEQLQSEVRALRIQPGPRPDFVAFCRSPCAEADLCDQLVDETFTFTANGAALQCEVGQAGARTFARSGAAALDSLWCLLSGSGAAIRFWNFCAKAQA
jgi:hypothetical protein